MSAPDVLPPGTRLAEHYVIREHIGDGGMARVYRAEREGSDRPLAIKVLSATIERAPAVADRFVQEAQIASRIEHANVIEVIELGQTEDQRPFMVMEFLEGEDLLTTLEREGPLPWARVRALLLQILAAVQAIHDEGIMHRDLKPANIFRTTPGGDEVLKIFDFGVAKVLEDPAPGTKPLTLIGQVLGTPEYMSPEQGMGSGVDHRTDLYSVGIIAYEMLTGAPPFTSDRPAKILVLQRNAPVPEMKVAGTGEAVDPEVAAIVARALAKRVDDRYASANEFAAALQAGVAP